MILLIDNYDSFSHNLYQAVGTIHPDVRVVRNDELTVAEIRELAPSHLLLSPGPGRPADAGVCVDVVRELAGEVPMLGICLGHQAIFEAFGGTVSYARSLMHGKSSMISVDVASPLFAGLPEQIQAARYHSLAGAASTLPEQLRVIATADDGEIMAISHESHPVYGVQFHPESIMTPQGQTIIRNFLTL